MTADKASKQIIFFDLNESCDGLGVTSPLLNGHLFWSQKDHLNQWLLTLLDLLHRFQPPSSFSSS